MAPAEDADITPFGMSCTGGAPPLALQPGWGCAWTISSTSLQGDTQQGVTFEIEPSPQPMAAELDRLWQAKGTMKGGTARVDRGGDNDDWRALPRGAARLAPDRPHVRPVTELFYPSLQDPPPGHDGRNAGGGR